ncbi:hypothetical protein PYCC9005_005720 [Savitreella phatthalungensis]
MVWTPQSNTDAAAGSVDRNKDPLLSILKDIDTASPISSVVELASGYGDHAVHFAAALPNTSFVLTEAQSSHLPTLQQHVDSQPNIVAAHELNVLNPDHWNSLRNNLPVKQVDLILCINMIHLCPWSATETLFAQAAALQHGGSQPGKVMLYGAFLQPGGGYSSPGDEKFDLDIRSRDPSFGLRDPARVHELAINHGYTGILDKDMPAGNKAFVWQRSPTHRL